MYSDRLIVEALIIMIIRRLYSAYNLLAFLEQDMLLTQHLRDLLTENVIVRLLGDIPNYRTVATKPYRIRPADSCQTMN